MPKVRYNLVAHSLSQVPISQTMAVSVLTNQYYDYCGLIDYYLHWSELDCVTGDALNRYLRLEIVLK